MKWEIDREALLSALTKVVGITDKKSTMQVLSHVLLEATEEQQLYLSATDLDISLKTQVEAQVSLAGRTTVSARKFLELIKELRNETVRCELGDNERLRVAAGRTQYKLATIPAADFPHFSIAVSNETFEVEAGALRRVLTRTVYPVPMEEDSLSIPGLYWHPVGEDLLRMVGSDGHRLAYDQIPFPALQFMGDNKGITVPRKGIQEILRLLEKTDQISLGLYENRLFAQTPNARLSIQLLEEDFPQYDLIIPQEASGFFEMDRQALIGALKRMAVVTDQTWISVRMTIRPDLLILEAGNPELGTAQEELPIHYDGEEFTVAYNIRYVIEALQNMQAEKVRVQWLDEYHGGLFLEPDNPDHLALVMPMMV
ncbi:DNA polymerase III, beta subunit [Desulfacinum hydrothermale DSM 13146]|uniref:Beta sliding clamp n=1 Tax=Desulfacinum hydrothermale DSM 13146 TaxID=1121390 RepID=A0A1W1XHV5_9BACT|nr:DNA polymerase III subunit beta [Desulfacinum hydrothermale]SMC23540.1 DNA polymerase III, beta subunit [Desulfacinum hydrothermale DSM 13146]